MIRIASILVLTAAFAAASEASAQSTHSPEAGVTIPRCVRIAALGPSFLELAKACEYALSPQTLPDFECAQTVRRFVSADGANNWQPFDVLTDEASFERGRERYSNFAVDGQPVRKLAKPHPDPDLFDYLQQRYSSRHIPLLLDLAHFGEDLAKIFDPKNRANFQSQGEINVAGELLTVFSFRITKADSKSGGNVGIYDGAQYVYTGSRGYIWIDPKTSNVRRIVLHYTQIDPKFFTSAEASSTDYGAVLISGLGQFHLPTGGDSMYCTPNNQCAGNTIQYADCHKFAASSRILPAQPQK